MQVHSILDHSRVNGPGLRTVVWLQGCSLQCPGCWNPDTHKHGSGKFYTPSELGHRILQGEVSSPLARTLSREIDGVTFSGGEPIEQLDDGLDWVVSLLKARRPDLSIGLYTGYSLAELEKGRFRSSANKYRKFPLYKKSEAWTWLRGQLDFAVMGRYNQLEKDDSRPLCSSKNQELHLFSDRYTPADFEAQSFEVHISDGGMVQVTGFPPEGL